MIKEYIKLVNIQYHNTEELHWRFLRVGMTSNVQGGVGLAVLHIIFSYDAR